MLRTCPSALAIACLLLLTTACATGGAAPSDPAPEPAAAPADAARPAADATVATGADPTEQEEPVGGSTGDPAEAAPTAPETDGPAVTPEDFAATAFDRFGSGEAEEDVEWTVDPENGLEYRIVSVEKREGAYRRTEDGRARFPLGVTFEIVDETETHLFLKHYRPVTVVKETKRQAVPTEEEIAAVARSFDAGLETVDEIRLEPFDQGLPRAGQWRDGFDLADLDGDGRLDIVFGPSRKGIAAPNVFRHEGSGVWKRWEPSYPNLGYDYGDAAAGDLDGDGHLDLVFGVHLRGIRALRRVPGEDRFEPWTEGIQFDIPGQGGDASSFSSREVELIDWNRDGLLDILAFGEGPKGRRRGSDGISLLGAARGLVLYVNEGEGTWRAARLDEGKGTFGSRMALADFDGDGETDVALASRVQGDGQIIYRRAEDGTLEPQPVLGLRDSTFIEAVAALPAADPATAAALVVGYRGRHHGVWRTGVEVLSGPGWAERRLLRADEHRDGISDIRAGDVDGDGLADVVAATGSGELWIFLARPDGSFVAEASPELPPAVSGCSGSEIRLADLDGDGRSEIVVGFAGEQVGITAVAGLSKPGCPGEGSLRAWRPVATAAAG